MRFIAFLLALAAPVIADHYLNNGLYTSKAMEQAREAGDRARLQSERLERQYDRLMEKIRLLGRQLEEELQRY